MSIIAVRPTGRYGKKIQHCTIRQCAGTYMVDSLLRTEN